MKRPSWEQEEIDDYIRWAAGDQARLGLEVITDGEGYRENMYYFYQKRVDGVTFENMQKRTFGDAGFERDGNTPPPEIISRFLNT